MDILAPWITFKAYDYIKRFIHSDMKVFELGIGGSTLFFIDHGSAIISVEHDPMWIKTVTDRIISSPHSSNLRIEFVEKDPIGLRSHDRCLSYSRDYFGISFCNYVTHIEDYNDFFDLIFIDGRARSDCLKISINKLASGGIIVLDNSNRKEYSEGIEYLTKHKGFIQLKMTGPALGQEPFSETSIFKLP